MLFSKTATRAGVLTKTRQLAKKVDLPAQNRSFSSKRVHVSSCACERESQHGSSFERLKNIPGATSPFVFSHRNVTTSTIKKEDGVLTINYGNRELKLPYIWLRNHCRCKVCYNHETSQKNVDSFSVTLDISPNSAEVEEDGRTIKLEWPDGHQTEYDIDWLVEHSYSTVSKSKTPFFLWDKKTIQSVPLPVVSYEDYRDDSGDGLKKTLYNLLSYGFSIIEGVTPSTKETQTAVQRISFVQETVFGHTWSFITSLQRTDTTYTNLFLGPHTDTTYFTLPAGISVFHCLWHDGKGGDMLLVDGFHTAEKFRCDHPDDFDLLTKAEVPHEYKDGDRYHAISHGTVLSVHPGSGEVMQVRFNPYDMAPIDTIPSEDIPHFYSAYSKLTSYIHNPDNEYWLKLHPGMVLLVNNWRVLHGRASFTGRRVMCGCYLSRDDWMNKARVFNLV